MNIKQITFSPTGGTRKVADAIASGICKSTEIVELCSKCTTPATNNELFIEG